MRTYGQLFRTPEFTPLFLSACLQTAAGTASALALSTLVYARTGSPLLAALGLFGGAFAQFVGAMTVLSVADRVPPRTVLVTTGLLYALIGAALAVPGLPGWGMVLLVLGTGLVASGSAGVRWGLLGEILPDDAYLFGRSVFGISSGAMQILGFGLGGLLVGVLSTRATLLVAVALYLGAALVARFGLTARPPRATGRPSVRCTWQVNRRLWALPARRHVYLALWVPNGLVVGCEALFVPYAPNWAGALFVTGAVGMIAGNTLLGRVVPGHWRPRLVTPLRVLLAAPYLFFALPLPAPVALTAVLLATAGFSAGLLLQERLLALTPTEIRGQALGLHSSGMLAMQAVAATLAGAVAQYLTPGTAMTVMAVISLVVTAVLTPALRRPLPTSDIPTAPTTPPAPAVAASVPPAPADSVSAK
ncbi:Predicted arabinose efflux permease, MFS family [Micromonospora pallida]|uniref:Predicted arabinose efflux permease, MFS family n=1 Tax=Micromonospora pallida TaxID=145854 RepID=A0A1C6SEP6_9ACTN|nr:MFS transporter [Micromonospora pallida]SCL27891.1 Predicted arabinose efflux permease, MFS family [Micromonospora pallida]